MKIKLALLLSLLALTLSACSYFIVEDPPVQVGSPAVLSKDSGR